MPARTRGNAEARLLENIAALDDGPIGAVPRAKAVEHRKLNGEERLVAGLLKQAIADLTPGRMTEAAECERYRSIAFFEGELFQELCDLTGLDAEDIQRRLPLGETEKV